MSAHELLKRADEIYGMRKLAFLAGVEAFCLQAGMSRSELIPFVKVAEELVEGSGDLHDAMSKVGMLPPTTVGYGSSGGRLKGNRPYLPPSPNWGDATKQTMTPTVGASGSPTTNDPTPAAAAAPAATTTPAAAAAKAPRRAGSAVSRFGTADQIHADWLKATSSSNSMARSMTGADEAQKRLTGTQRYETTKDEATGRTTGAVHPTSDLDWKRDARQNAATQRELSLTAHEQYRRNAASMGPARAAIFSRTEHPGAFESIKAMYQRPDGVWTTPVAGTTGSPNTPGYDPSGPNASTRAEGIYHDAPAPAAAPGPTPVAAPVTPPAPAPVTPVTPPATQPAPQPVPVDPSLS